MRRTRNSYKGSKGSASAGTIFMVMAIVIGTGVTVAANAFSSSGLQAKTIQKEIDALAEENRELELKATSLKSLQAIKGSAAAQQDLVQVKSLKHIHTTGAPRPEAVGTN